MHEVKPETFEIYFLSLKVTQINRTFELLLIYFCFIFTLFVNKKQPKQLSPAVLHGVEIETLDKIFLVLKVI